MSVSLKIPLPSGPISKVSTVHSIPGESSATCPKETQEIHLYRHGRISIRI